MRETLLPQVAANYRPTGMKPVVAKHKKECFRAFQRPLAIHHSKTPKLRYSSPPPLHHSITPQPSTAATQRGST